jgi:hypothetical protein
MTTEIGRMESDGRGSCNRQAFEHPPVATWFAEARMPQSIMKEL